MKNRDDMIPNDRQISRKRRNSSSSNCSSSKIQQDLEELQFAKKRHGIEGNDSFLLDDNDFLTLSLTFGHEKFKTTATVPPSSLPLSSPFPPEQEFMPQSLPSQTLTAPFTHPLQLSSSLSLMAATSPPIIDAPQLETLTTAPPPLMPADQPPVYPSSHRREVPTPRTSRPPRARRNHAHIPLDESKPFIPLFPWAAKRAAVYSLEELMAKKIEIITGLVQCKRCEKQYEMGFNLREKFLEVGSFIADNKESMHDRAPSVWMNPVLPICKFCEQENSVKPVISEKKKSINWLFLLLGQMLGCCTLDQLKYFCKHTDNHRTGAKDRVLYLTYLGLCKQLDPCGPFDR